MKKVLLASVAALTLGVAAPTAYADPDPLTAPINRAPDSQEFVNPAGTFNPPDAPGVGGAGGIYSPNAAELDDAISNAGIATAVGNKAVGYQEGDDNTGTVDQTGSAYGHAFIQQVDNDAMASIVQQDTGTTPPGNTRNNRAQIFQFENRGPASATVEQDHQPGTAGADNVVEVHQEESLDATADVYQRGAGNDATVLQSDSVNDSADAVIKQGADFASYDNAAVIYQNDNFGKVDAEILQDGDENLADILQFENSGIVEAAVDQTGNFNNAVIAQYNNSAAFGVDAEIVQTGDGNDGWILQRDQDNAVAEILQDGNSNTLDISQTGTVTPSNSALFTQVGDSNSMSVMQ
jgi:hypothetical protein